MQEIFTCWIPLGVFFSVLQVIFFIIFTFAKSLIRSSTAFKGMLGWEVNQDLKIFETTVFWSSSSSSLASSSGASGNSSSSRSPSLSSSLLLNGSLNSKFSSSSLFSSSRSSWSSIGMVKASGTEKNIYLLPDREKIVSREKKIVTVSSEKYSWLLW